MDKEKLKELQRFDKQLSKNFRLLEFINTSCEYDGVELEQLNQLIDYELSVNRLVKKVLQPARDHIGAIKINSGVRCVRVNELVGGNPMSQHLFGEAADVVASDLSKLFSFIANKLEFDQLIAYPSFVHVSYRHGKNRKMILFNGSQSPAYFKEWEKQKNQSKQVKLPF